MDEQELNTFEDKNLMGLILASLVKKLGGDVVITQKDIDDVTYRVLLEGRLRDGSITFTLSEKENLI